MFCSLFGHRNCTDDVSGALLKSAEKLINECNVDCFFVGNQGSFDMIAISVLKQLKEKYAHIRCYVVLAYPNIYKSDFQLKNLGSLDTIYPGELTLVSNQLAIPSRNKWMARQADYVLCYIVHSQGGAAQATDYAKKLGKVIINIS